MLENTSISRSYMFTGVRSGKIYKETELCSQACLRVAQVLSHVFIMFEQCLHHNIRKLPQDFDKITLKYPKLPQL